MSPFPPSPSLASTQEAMLTTLTSAMADLSRVRILCALMDGRAYTATELSAAADISPSTTSAHLKKLMENDLIACAVQGRHRYYRIHRSEIAQLLEQMMGIVHPSFTPPAPRTPGSLRFARTCYDHLAGELAVEIYAKMLTEGWLTPQGDTLTDKGKAACLALGLSLSPHNTRPLCRPCLDWSERRFHLAGQLGAELLNMMLNKGWLQNHPGCREITLTPLGQQALGRVLGTTRPNASVPVTP